MTKIVPPTMLVSADNVPILAKEPWTVDPTQFVKQLTTDQSVFAPKATKGLLQAKDASKLGAVQARNVQVTSGATKANVKIPVLTQVLVERTHNVVFYTIKHYVLVLLALLVTHAKNVFRTLMSVCPTLAVPTLDVPI